VAGERVLIIDDDRSARDFLANQVLQPAGYDVLLARDGADGLQQALREAPDLIFLDMQMPRLTSAELLNALAQQHREPPLILTTRFGSEALAVHALRMGARDYLTKPFVIADAQAAVERALREVRLRRERDQLTRRLMTSNQQLERRLQELNTLISVGKSVIAQLDLQAVLNSVVEAAVRITAAEEGLLLLLDDDTGELYVRAAQNVDDDMARALRLRVDDSLAGQVIRSGQPMAVGDAGLQKIKTAYLVRAVVYVPLKSRDRTMGVLGVDNQQRDRAFSQHDIGLLSALADYAAIAIENARLYAASQAAKGRLEATLHSTEDAVIVVNEAGRLALYNAAAARAFSLDDEAVSGRPLYEVIQHEGLLALLEPNAAETRRGEIKLGDGRILNAHATAVEGAGTIVVMQDITHLKTLDRLKSELVASVSHDLRSPLTAILGYLDLLGRGGPLNEQQQLYVQQIQHSVQTITALIGDVLDLSRIEAGLDQAKATIDLTPLLQEIMESFRPHSEAKKQRLTLGMARSLPPMLGNATRLRQVIANLVDNAIKYTAEGGQVQVDAFARDGQIVLRVSDTGIGIATPDQAHIFDKFYRTRDASDKSSGSGLGLAIVRSVVEGHGGRVWVESRAGSGSVFTVVLPALAPRPVAVAEA
jgi:two-component system NtrC family sensor kinase